MIYKTFFFLILDDNLKFKEDLKFFSKWKSTKRIGAIDFEITDLKINLFV